MTGETTQYGFKYGPCEVVRICGNDKLGVLIAVKGTKEQIEIRVTPSGLLRVWPVTKRIKTK